MVVTSLLWNRANVTEKTEFHNINKNECFTIIRSEDISTLRENNACHFKLETELNIWGPMHQRATK
jgi:hypothetical protein